MSLVGPTSFSCPHCVANYPFKAALVGKAIRCKSCQGVFRLRPDGLAERVMEAPAPAASGSGSGVTSAPPPPAPELAKDNARSGRLQVTSQQDDLRKQMAANLAESMGKALESDAVKAEEKKTKTGAQGKTSEGKKRSGKVILTGEGERAAENDQRWLLGGLAALVVLIGLIWVLTRENSREQAVDAFTAEVPTSDNVYGKRAQAIVNRAWIIAPALNRPGVDPIIGADNPIFSTISTIPASALAPLVKLKGQRFYRDLGLWIEPANLPKVKSKALSGTPASAVLKNLANGGLDDDGLAILDQLLHGEPSPATKDILERLVDDLPPKIRICRVHGAQGSSLIDIGGGYRIRSGPFTATLVAFEGPGWSGQWRVLDFTLAQPGH